MPRSLLAPAALAVTLLAAWTPSPARAQPAFFTPTLYSLAPLPADLRQHPNLTAMVKLWPFVGDRDWRAATPEEAADIAVTTIRRRVREGSLPPGRLHLHMTWFGTGDPTMEPKYDQVARVLFHPDDALAPTFAGQPLADYFRTPWHAHGVEAGRDWMRRFTAQFARRQAQVPNIPNPAWVTFDTESLAFPEDFAALCRLFDALKADPRYDDPRSPVAHTGRTLKALYDAAGSPRYTPQRAADFRGTHADEAFDNVAFSNFYRTLACDARAAAIDDAVRTPLTQAFPGVRYGDVASRTFDGVDDPATPPFGPRVPRGQSYAWWRMTTTGPGDADVIYFYDVWNAAPRPAESHWDAVIREHRATLEAMIHAPAPNGQPPRHRSIMPWILLPGQESGANTHRPDGAETRAMLRLLVAHGVPEILVFATDPAARDHAHWDALVTALDDATASVVTRVDVLAGTPAIAPDPDLLARANWDLLPVTLDADGRAAIEITLATRLAGRDRARVTLEFRAPGPALASAALDAWDFAASAWRPLGSAAAADLARPGRVRLDRVLSDAGGLLSPAGDARLRVTFTGAASTEAGGLDFVAITGESPTP